MKMIATATRPTPFSTARAMCFGLGAGLYATSFFLPAISVDSAPIPGYMCALFALNPVWLTTPVGVLAVASGLLNPIVLACASAWLLGSEGRTRQVLACAAVVSIAAAAAFLAVLHAVCRYGFFAWATGAMLMVSCELMSHSPKNGQ
jgi:hypothetical protein